MCAAGEGKSVRPSVRSVTPRLPFVGLVFFGSVVIEASGFSEVCSEALGCLRGKIYRGMSKTYRDVGGESCAWL